MSKDDQFSRRDFLKHASTAFLAGVAATAPGTASGEWQNNSYAGEAKSRVVLIRDELALDDEGKPNPLILPRMLDEGVVALTGKANAREAWKSLLKPEDILGIKTNVWRFLRTPECLEEQIAFRAGEVGIAKDRIGVGDRRILGDPIFDSATALVNIRPMRTHHWAGVGSLIKNYIMFAPAPVIYHPDTCANLASVWFLPGVLGKTRLNVLVMLTPLFHGKGPHHYVKKYTWDYRGLLIGTDPVAVDATGVHLLQAMRTKHFGDAKPFDKPVKHIWVADKKFNLGTSDPAKIDLVKLGWEKDRLI
jgi:hypothetical protein